MATGEGSQCKYPLFSLMKLFKFSLLSSIILILGCGCKFVPLEKQVQILLFYLGHGIQYRLVTFVISFIYFFPLCYKFLITLGFYFSFILFAYWFLQIADRFNLSESTVFQIVEDLCTLLVEKLMPEYIKWPNSEAQERTANFFEDAYGFEGVISCIDGTHIPVHKPLYCAQDYFMRKQVYAIQVQAVCDERLIFTHIFAGLNSSGTIWHSCQCNCLLFFGNQFHENVCISRTLWWVA